MFKDKQRKTKENKSFYPCPNCKKVFFGMVVELCDECLEKEAYYDMDWDRSNW